MNFREMNVRIPGQATSSALFFQYGKPTAEDAEDAEEARRKSLEKRQSFCVCYRENESMC